MGCKNCLQYLLRLKPFLHFPFSCLSIGTDCQFIIGFFGFSFHSCFGLSHTTHAVQSAVLLYSNLIRKPNSAEGTTFSHRTTCTMVTTGPMLTITEGWSPRSEQSRCILSHLESIMKGFYNFPLSSNGFRDLPILRLDRKAGNKQSGISPVIISWKLLLMI